MKYARVVSFIFLYLVLVGNPVVAKEIPALQSLLERKLQNCNCSAILADPDRGTILASFHSGPIMQEKHPPGSLMKIFTLIAYAQTKFGKFPHYNCPPSMSRDPYGCWDRNGHGTVDAQKALAVSCNVYFRQLSSETSSESFVAVAHEFGILEAHEEWNKSETIRSLMTGKSLEWSADPLRLLRAYSSLFNGGSLWKLPYDSDTSKPANVSAASPAVIELIRNGLRDGAINGTSTEARKTSGVEMLGKTGTSLMIVNGKTDHSRTQGWWIGLYPVDSPEIAVMTFVRNGRGASDAAPNGGRALAAWVEYSRRKL